MAKKTSKSTAAAKSKPIKAISKKAKKQAKTANKTLRTNYIRKQSVIKLKDMVELPAIDMRDSDAEITKQLIHMLTTVGFLHLKNIEGFDEDELFKICKEFHSIPESIKHKLKWKNHNPTNSNRYRGLAPFVDNDPSHKELYDMGGDYDLVSEGEKKYPLYERTPFPQAAKYQHILKAFQAQFARLKAVAIKLITLISKGLGRDENLLTQWFDDDCLSTFRSIYY
jgi:isopenicillin N synthase-like dioxygenase